MLERIEEDLIRSILKTERGCPIYLLYLESGHIPARFYIKRTKLVFFHYILTQNEDSLLYQFLMAQKKEPKPGDWYSEIQDIMKDFKIQILEENIKQFHLVFSKILSKEALRKLHLGIFKRIKKRELKELKLNTRP